MLTVVTLLLLPALLLLAALRIARLPRLWRDEAALNPRWPRRARAGLVAVWVVLCGGTVALLGSLAHALVDPPLTLAAALRQGAVVMVYPFVVVGCEWLLYHCLRRPRRPGAVAPER